jgi:hypothetical protein
MLTRRPALAAAFALTVLLGYAIVAYGSKHALFAWTQGRGGEAAEASIEGDQANALAGWPEMLPDVIEVPADPLIVTQYQYVDQVIPAPSMQQLSTPPNSTDQSISSELDEDDAAPADSSDPADEPTDPPYEDDEYDEHGDDDEDAEDDEDEEDGRQEHEDEEDHDDEHEHDEEHGEDDH